MYLSIYRFTRYTFCFNFRFFLKIIRCVCIKNVSIYLLNIWQWKIWYIDIKAKLYRVVCVPWVLLVFVCQFFVSCLVSSRKKKNTNSLSRVKQKIRRRVCIVYVFYMCTSGVSLLSMAVLLVLLSSSWNHKVPSTILYSYICVHIKVHLWRSK